MRDRSASCSRRFTIPPLQVFTVPMAELIKVLIVICLIGIVASLGAGLFHLVRDKGESKKMARVLTVRIVLSVALFVLLMTAWAMGLIQPLGTK
jgi:cytochrome bd-type quinol oxidase subunit 2